MATAYRNYQESAIVILESVFIIKNRGIKIGGQLNIVRLLIVFNAFCVLERDVAHGVRRGRRVITVLIATRAAAGTTFTAITTTEHLKIICCQF